MSVQLYELMPGQFSASTPQNAVVFTFKQLNSFAYAGLKKEGVRPV